MATLNINGQNKSVDAAVTVVAPAIGNAVFNAVGARVRSLPITAEAVRRR
jgi:CO/xanthine dehydrogenase Mo-binding subunit